MRCDICRVIKKKIEFPEKPCKCSSKICGLCMAKWLLTQDEKCPGCSQLMFEPKDSDDESDDFDDGIHLRNQLISAYQRAQVSMSEYIEILNRQIEVKDDYIKILMARLDAIWDITKAIILLCIAYFVWSHQ